MSSSLPHDWKFCPIDECLDAIIDYRGKTPKKTTQGIPLVTAKIVKDGTVQPCTEFIAEDDYDDWMRRGIPEPGDVIITTEAPLGEIAVIPDFKVALAQRLIVLRGKSGILENGFLKYLMQSDEIQNQLRARESGTTVIGIKQSELRKVQLPIPPLPEQKRIAQILGTLDDKIELNRRMNETLEAAARALFKSWFVDFDPVRYKLAGKDPCAPLADGGLGIDPQTAALFPDKLVPSPLGMIPEGWEVKPTEDVADKVGMGPFGSSIKVATFVDKGIPIVSGQHLKRTMLEDNNFRFITSEHAEKLKNANVFRGDVVFTHAGNIGQVAYIPDSSRYKRYVLSQRQFYMRCNRELISPYYVVYFFKTSEGQHQLLANRSSTGVPSISRPVTYLRTIELVIPSKGVLDSYDNRVHSLNALIGNNNKQSNTLASIRDALLPKLISGEIEVPRNMPDGEVTV